MKFRRLALATATLTSLMASLGAQAMTVVLAEDFESYPSVPVVGFTTVGGTLGSWAVGGTIDLIRGNYGAISGISVDLAGTPGPGSLSQTFSTMAGYSYTLTFDRFANGAGPTSLQVDFGTVSTMLTQPASVTPETFSFVGDGNLATLKFTSNPGFSGPVLDNILVVSAVPEASTYAMFLAGLGMMGFLAQRRRSGR